MLSRASGLGLAMGCRELARNSLRKWEEEPRGHPKSLWPAPVRTMEDSCGSRHRTAGRTAAAPTAPAPPPVLRGRSGMLWAQSVP